MRSPLLRGPCRSRWSAIVCAVRVLVVGAVALGLTGCASRPEPSPSARSQAVNPVAPSPVAPSVESRARTFIAELAAGDWSHPKTAFDAAMAGAAPPEKLSAIWRALEADAGAFRNVEGAAVHEEAGHQIVHVSCSFDRG